MTQFVISSGHLSWSSTPTRRSPWTTTRSHRYQRKANATNLQTKTGWTSSVHRYNPGQFVRQLSCSGWSWQSQEVLRGSASDSAGSAGRPYGHSQVAVWSCNGVQSNERIPGSEEAPWEVRGHAEEVSRWQRHWSWAVSQCFSYSVSFLLGWFSWRWHYNNCISNWTQKLKLNPWVSEICPLWSFNSGGSSPGTCWWWWMLVELILFEFSTTWEELMVRYQLFLYRLYVPRKTRLLSLSISSRYQWLKRRRFNTNYYQERMIRFLFRSVLSASFCRR